MSQITITSSNFNGYTGDITFYPFSGGSISYGSQTIPYTIETENFNGEYTIDLNYEGTPVVCGVQVGASPCVYITLSKTGFDYSGLYTFLGYGYISYDSRVPDIDVICDETNPISQALYYFNDGFSVYIMGVVDDIVARTTELRITQYTGGFNPECGNTYSGFVSTIIAYPTYNSTHLFPSTGTYSTGLSNPGDYTTYSLQNIPSCIAPSPSPTPTPSITPSITPTITPTPSITPTITPTPSATPPTTYMSASGGTETTIVDGGDTYRVHTFTNTGTTSFEVLSLGSDNTIEYLIAAGGGGGGGSTSLTASGGGGGGAGGVLTGSTTMIATGIYNAIVGSGGIGVDNAIQGGDGDDSSWNSITATGGGGGGSSLNQSGRNGGSGGGHGARTTTTPQSGTGISGQGFSGGTSPNSGTRPAGGSGGGAAEPGYAGINPGNFDIQPGNGGNGIQSSINGTATYYGGGGGASNWEPDRVPGSLGGLGGGGNGETYSGGYIAATDGATNTAGGGGGGGRDRKGGDGGSGIIILRYKIA